MSVSEVTVPFTDGSAVPSPAIPQRPDNVPEKFWDAEKGAIRTADLLKSYSELEKGRSPAAPAGDEPPATPPVESAPTPEEAEAAAAAEAAGISMADLEAEFSEAGTLSEASYSKLEKAGFTKDVVDEFIAYRSTKAEEVQKGFMAIVGGETEYARMNAWAAQSYTAEQAEAFNDAVNSGKKGSIEAALKALKADFTAANPARPKFVQPDAAGASSGGGSYASMAELMRDQADPKYASDPAFRAAVAAKLQRSNIR